MSLTESIVELIDLRSFSNLWYWIALAVTWSSAAHWTLGVPYDMLVRARRRGGQAEADFVAVLGANVNRILSVSGAVGYFLLGFVSFILVSLAILGFFYRVEFAQAVFLLLFPLSFVAALSVRTAHRIAANRPEGAALYKAVIHLRLWTQGIGILAIFVTAFWGMLHNVNFGSFPG